MGRQQAKVPYHPKERTNQHVETYPLVSLLGSLPWDSLCFPVEVFRRGRLDFLVVCDSCKIGLEHFMQNCPLTRQFYFCPPLLAGGITTLATKSERTPLKPDYKNNKATPMGGLIVGEVR